MSKKNDDLREIEERWRSYWAEKGTYRYDPTKGRDETFVVDTPPPTVSGALHIGHVFSFTHTDLMVRYQRMTGKNIFYPMGWDDNGLATERRVQNIFSVRCDPSVPYDPDLNLEFGREGEIIPVSRLNFIELCAVVVTEDEAKFKDLFQRLGLSVDWDETYATIDERSRYVSQLSFLRLLDKDEAELREAPTMWDVDFQTAVAQAEVEDREREGEYHHIRFEVEGGDEIVVATTRPELLPACVAVVAHPDDARYKDMVGKNAITPLFKAPVPIIADEGADPEKGTGILMNCTFGDASDIDWWRALGVPAREVIGRDGKMVPVAWGEDAFVSLDAAGAQKAYDELSGLYINQARKRMIELLGEAGALAGEPEKTIRAVKFYEKGERPLEFVVSRQWFIKIMDKKDQLLEQGRKINWRPEMYLKRYLDWVEGLNQDWCISRQRYFGVPIPIWYRVRDDGSVDHTDILRPRTEDLPIDPSSDAPPGFTPEQRGEPGGFTGDPDVFDTWVTSSRTPLIPSGWPDDMARHEALYPNDLRPQAHDIIRTWAFYTITRAWLEDGSIPWKNAAISGFVVDPNRKKLSKSKGNAAVVPTDILDEFGSDGVRYWAGAARLGVDTTFDTNVMREGKRLVTKLRNAARLVQMFEGDGSGPTHPLDRALIARLGDLIEHATSRWEAWDHAGALAATESWFWGDLTDNYLEMSKNRAYAGDPSAIGTLRIALSVVLRLFAPYLPFVTEEVWNATSEDGISSIHRAPWPTRDELPDGVDSGCFDAAVEVLTNIRRLKSEAKVSLKTPVDQLVVKGPPARIDLLKQAIEDVAATVNVKSYELVADESLEEFVWSATLGEPEPKPSG